MIIIKIMGGLGNQMFQYAMYEKLKYLGKDVKVDRSSFYAQDDLRKYELGVFKNLQPEKAEQDEIEHYLHQESLWEKALRKALHSERKVYYLDGMFYDEKIYSIQEGYVEGFWQSEKYFSDIEKVIRQRFEFPKIQDAENEKFLSMIHQTHSVSIHVRRGDYLSETNQKIYGRICTLDYYKKAIRYFEEKYEDVTFFVFSNDLEWAKENLEMKKSCFVDCNTEETAIYDMYLMSECRDNIIANSSFSWWGAWMNSHEEKEVIAPSKWLNTVDVRDIWCEGWKKLDG